MACLARLEPAIEEKERGGPMEHAPGDPHDESGELLVCRRI
jgi:hypothetical protein